jgi:mono/diheme cytochrome c family protein
MHRRWKIAGLAVVAVVAAGFAAGAAIAWHPAIPPIAPPPAAGFPAAATAEGARLAAIGDCAVCHTATHGQPYAGGRPLPTPFGTIYVTNITPDPETGIGRWSEAAFRRAMRDGIDRAGRHLYPALPYPHFTRATDADIAAMYAFLMTRVPVHADAPPNALPFPLNIRAILAGWNLLFLHRGPWQPDPAQTAEWNRGAYLAEAIGHCGACHTPHNLLGAEKPSNALGGGDAEGWDAPALQSASPAGAPWTIDSLTDYLRNGFAAGHGAAAGPMDPVTQELAAVPDQDLRAIATYVHSLMPSAPPPALPPPPQAAPATAAAAIFAGACATCHAPDAPMTRGGAPSLSLSTAVNAPDPRNVIQVILHGLPWREGIPQPYMPGFAAALSDRQVADLAGYLRTNYSHQPAWEDIESQVHSARQDGGS